MAEEKKVKAPGGPGGRGPKVENPGKIFKRLFGFMMESYRSDLYHSCSICRCPVIHVFQNTD